jgi:hypothetical protein
MKSIHLLAKRILRLPARWWRRGIWQKIALLFVLLVAAVNGVMYGIAEWYIHSEASKPFTMGVSFIPDYAQYLGVDPQANFDALLQIGVRNFRLVSYWGDIEPQQGQYDFSQLDWEFAKAKTAHAHIILTVGLRQPRWPECHQPSWVDTSQPLQTWHPQLEQFMTKVINRYKDNPSLQSYQLENEYFLKGFGTSTNFSRSRLVSEYNLVRHLDPHHHIIIPRSNNALGWPVGAPTPDEYSISIYRRVWDATLTKRYLEYPFPSWFYGFTAGWQKLRTGRNMIVGEFQAEPWPPHGQTIPETPLIEQNKSFNAQRFESEVGYIKRTGMRSVYFWGAEYWYYRLVVLHDPSVWNVAKQEFSQN